MLEIKNLIGKTRKLSQTDLKNTTIFDSVNFALKKINDINKAIKKDGGGTLFENVELANISSMLGNFIALGVEKNSREYRKNIPHTFPDLLNKKSKEKNIEIKVSHGKNLPKGHLPKEGFYLITRYSLINNKNIISREDSEKIGIYEIRIGYLKVSDFNISSTENDSGKTASIKTDSLENMELIYHDTRFDPRKNESKTK